MLYQYPTESFLMSTWIRSLGLSHWCTDLVLGGLVATIQPSHIRLVGLSTPPIGPRIQSGSHSTDVHSAAEPPGGATDETNGLAINVAETTDPTIRHRPRQ